MIEQLQDLRDSSDCGGTEVLVVHQPSYPLQETIGGLWMQGMDGRCDDCGCLLDGDTCLACGENPDEERFVYVVASGTHRKASPYAIDLSVSRIATVIDRLRKVPQSPNRKPENYPTLSLRTKNFYAKSLKQFTAWMVRERRLEHDLLRHLPMRKTDTDIRHDQRALTDEEFTKLVQAARTSVKVVEGVTGHERSFLYTMARMTGLRRSELASLTATSFTLSGDPFVIVEAAYSKHRERDFVPLHPDLVPLLRGRISKLYNGAPLFPLLEHRKTAQMMQVDLEAVGIPYQDASDRFADFHALRHSFITALWESGASPEVVMALARHRSLNMTMRYTHVDRSSQVRAVNSMRSPLGGEDEK